MPITGNRQGLYLNPHSIEFTENQTQMAEDVRDTSTNNVPHSFLSGVKYEHLVAGLSGGVVSTLATHPFDLIKLRFAVHDGTEVANRPKYHGLLHATRTIVRENGILGLFRGASANVAGAGSSWGLYFFFYNTFKFQLQHGDLDQQLSAPSHLLCATCAGVITLTLTNPIWVVKTRLCLTNTTNVPGYMRYKGLTDGLINLFRYEGVRGLYKGYLPGLFGTSHGAIQFMVYEELKKVYCNFYHISIATKLGPLEYIFMAASSKLVAASTTYPYQVIRARLQDQDQKYKGTGDMIKKIIKNEGLGGFYKGLSANLLKVVPATCITFVVYEYLSALLLGR